MPATSARRAALALLLSLPLSLSHSLPHSLPHSLAHGPWLGTGAALAQARGGENWPAVKCERYRKAYDEAIRRFGSKGLGPAFLARHDAFMESGCQTPPDVCPRSAEELNLANIMVMAGMNAGLSSTFMPFACRK